MLLVAAAAAHSPHDVATFVSVDPNGRVLTADTEVLAWSDDGGVLWSYASVPEGTPVCGTTDGALTILTDSAGAWQSDDGVTWTALPGPARGTACAPGILGGTEGLWVDGEQVSTTAVRAAAPGIVLFDDDTVALAPDWTPFPAEAFGTAVALDGETPVHATELSELMRWDGAAWSAVAGSPLGVTAFTIQDDIWLAGTAREGVWVSRDGGDTWDLEDDALESILDGEGAPLDGVHQLGFAIDGDHWYSAQWEGLWTRLASETRWSEATVDGIPRTRKVGWLADGTVIGAVYGGGVYRGTPGRDDWRMVSGDVPWPYPKATVVGGEHMYLIAAAKLYRSDNLGGRWSVVELDAESVGDFIALGPGYPKDPLVLVTAAAQDAFGVFRSEDAGLSWTWVALPERCTVKPQIVATDGTTSWTACGDTGELFRSDDRGVSWTSAGAAGSPVNDILPLSPPLCATDAGVMSWDEDFEVVALAGTAVEQLAEGPDGSVYGASSAEGVFALDGAEVRWLGWPVLDRVEDLEVSESGVLLAGTRTGMWTSEDGETWARANDVEYYDDRTQGWWWGDDWERVDGGRLITHSGRRGRAGAHAELDFTGAQLQLVGQSDEDAVVVWTVDGVSREQEINASAGYGRLTQWKLSPGPHRLSVDVVKGSLMIDFARTWREHRGENRPTNPPMPPTGCAGGLLLLTVPLFLGRRR